MSEFNVAGFVCQWRLDAGLARLAAAPDHPGPMRHCRIPREIKMLLHRKNYFGWTHAVQFELLGAGAQQRGVKTGLASRARYFDGVRVL